MNLEAKHLCKSIMNACNIDLSKSSCDFEDGGDATTIDATCTAASDTKSSTAQTDRCQVNQVSNKTTITDVHFTPKVRMKIDDTNADVCEIHAIITLNVVARNPDDNPRSISVEPFGVKVLSNEPSLSTTRNNTKRSSKCTCTLDERAKTGGCVESCKYSCKYFGIGTCNAFSLGTADYRMLLREKCNSMLIGGCRVPVCRNFKNKL